MNIKSRFHSGPNPTSNISYEVTGGRKSNFSCEDDWQAGAKERKAFGQEGNLGGGQFAFKFLMALGILHRYREGTRSGALGRGAQLIFLKSLFG